MEEETKPLPAEFEKNLKTRNSRSRTWRLEPKQMKTHPLMFVGTNRSCDVSGRLVVFDRGAAVSHSTTLFAAGKYFEGDKPSW